MPRRNQGDQASRWQRRDVRRRKERERVKKHGAGLRTVYANAVRKRLKRFKNGPGGAGAS